MNEKLILNNGTELEGHLMEVGRLFLYMNNISMTDAFELLNKPENTTVITWERYGETGTVTGYDHLTSISEEAGGMVSASLIK